MGRSLHSPVFVETGIQKLTREVAHEPYFEDNDALLLPHLVLPQGTIMGTDRASASASITDPSWSLCPTPIDPKREAARNFLATRISFNVNHEPNRNTPSRRPPPPDPDFEDDFNSLIAEAEEWEDQPPPPTGPAGFFESPTAV